MWIIVIIIIILLPRIQPNPKQKDLNGRWTSTKIVTSCHLLGGIRIL
jgi:hypothetical protein